MSNQLNITHLSSLSKSLSIPLSTLIKISKEINNLYSTKKLKKKDNSIREISVPNNNLKNIQKKINKFLLSKIANADSVHGWVKNRSRTTAAKIHVNMPHVYSFDIKSFFDSIHSTKVYKLFNITLNCSPSVSQILTKLTTYKHKLPQGGPCSPLIANLVLKSFDEDMTRYTTKRQAIYSRFGDDITVSSKQVLPDVEFVFQTTLEKHGFKLKNNKKIINANSKKSSIAILGLIVGKKLTIHKSKRRSLRAILHNAETTGIDKQNIENHPRFKQHLVGKISQIKEIQPKLGIKMEEKFNEINNESKA